MKVTVCGPNLSDQSSGEFHVHASECVKLEKYGPGEPFGGESPWALGEVGDRLLVVEAIYADIIAERGGEAEDLLDQLRFYPCCNPLLPRSTARPPRQRFQFAATVAIEARDEAEARRLLGALVSYRGDDPAGFTFALDGSKTQADRGPRDTVHQATITYADWPPGPLLLRGRRVVL